MRAPDLLGEELGSPWREDDAAPDALDELGRLARGLCRDDHRPAHRHDPVETARDDVSREAAREPDDVDVGRRERLRQHLARLVLQEVDALGLQQLRELH